MRIPVLDVGMRRRLTVVSLLGFSSGLPLALTDSTLQAWLATSEIDIATIGVFSLLSLPYILKFLWAPLADRFALPFAGRRRGWMMASQLAIAVIIFAFSSQDPSDSITIIACLAVCLAFASATQDVVVDAYRAEILPRNERGLGAGLSVAGYRVAMIVSGVGAFVLADFIGFGATYSAVAALALVGFGTSLYAHEPRVPAALPVTLREAVVQPFRVFLSQPYAGTLLALVCLYKVGDAAAGRLSMVFFLRELDFSLTEIGAYYKGFGIAASLLGGLVGGVLMLHWSLFRSLLVFAFLQALTNLGFLLLAIIGKSTAGMIAVIACENFSGGMGTAALVALMISACDARYTATQFALLTAVASLGRVLLGPPAGYLVESWGWANYFGLTVILAVPSIVLLVVLRDTLNSLGENANGTLRA